MAKLHKICTVLNSHAIKKKYGAQLYLKRYFSTPREEVLLVQIIMTLTLKVELLLNALLSNIFLTYIDISLHFAKICKNWKWCKFFFLSSPSSYMSYLHFWDPFEHVEFKNYSDIDMNANCCWVNITLDSVVASSLYYNSI